MAMTVRAPPRKFEGLKICIIRKGAEMGLLQYNILRKLVVEYGGQLVDDPCVATHVVTNLDFATAAKLFSKPIPKNTFVVSSDWISESVMSVEPRCSETRYEVARPDVFEYVKKYMRKMSEDTSPELHYPAPEPPPHVDERISSVPYVDSVAGREAAQRDVHRSFFEARPGVEKPSISGTNLNEHLTRPLYEQEKIRRSEGSSHNANVYHRAAAWLSRYNERIDSIDKLQRLVAEHSGEGIIGPKIAHKLQEILNQGSVYELKHISERDKVLEQFAQVYGAGPNVANRWYESGCRTLRDVLEKGAPTRQQAIGIEYFEELQQRIPRVQASEIDVEIRRLLLRHNRWYSIAMIGSYRRGRATVGDVDFIVSHADDSVRREIVPTIVNEGMYSGFITHVLIASDHTLNGICLHRGVHHQIDCWTFLDVHWPYALVHWTGSSHYIRELKRYAHTKGLSFTDVGFFAYDPQHSSKHTGPSLYSCTTEQDVFHVLGLPYVEPAARDV